jgi:hypothetical protein
VSKTIRLRGGRATTDRRLDAVPQFDQRSRRYPIADLFTDRQRTLCSRGWQCPTWLNQGQEGACVGFSWAHELAARPAEVEGVSRSLAIRIYEDARKVDEWPGERYDGTSVLAGAKVLKFRGYMQEYRWGFGLIQALQAVGHLGPVVVGMPWYESMHHPRPSGLLEVTKDKEKNRHAILVRGVALRARLKGERGPLSVVQLRNSWGRRWGVDGDCWLLVEDLEALLRDEGECCVAVGRNRKPDPAFLALAGER